MVWVWNLERNNNKDFVLWTKRELIKMQNYFLNELKVESSRYRRIRSALSSMSNYIVDILDREFPDFKNNVLKIEAPAKKAVREKTVLEEEQIKLVLDTFEKKKQYQRACLFALAVCSGSRKSELLRFKVDYFKDEYILFDSMYKTPEAIKTKGRDGGKMLKKYVLINPFKKYFDLWMEQRKEKGIDSEWLFVGYDGEQMKITGANVIAEAVTNIIGKDFYFHSLRHYFCTLLAKANIPDTVIADIFGWTSIEMTRIYKDIEIDDSLGNYFADGGIKQVEKKDLSDL